ncbi:HBR152Cp [Eremothecium sinecaudum]|uniref:mitogen-activated protein kinase kinase n=1 Tax=Eremothecium sinecaudum TaxID=45286 RepID=A0A109UWW4_9SACH|nr:HBR152Cp [Eremothecium sinecaudum]AMD19053.1 HBR152Cp [Eremothecium sinecaudum]
MTPIFKPPEPKKRSDRSPKLSLPPTLLSNVTNESKAYNTPTSGSYLPPSLAPTQIQTQDRRSAYELGDNGLGQQLSASQNDYTSSASLPSARVKLKRPVPPSMPNIRLQVDNDHQQSSASPTVDPSNERGNGASSFSSGARREFHVPLSGYRSNLTHTDVQQLEDAGYQTIGYNMNTELSSGSSRTLISTPGETNSSDNTSAASDMKDVDELDDTMWNHLHLKHQIIELGVLGEGAGGSVTKCKLKDRSKIFALKTITTLNTDHVTQKQIFRELQFNKSCQSEFIVRYYGMFTDEETSSIYIAMEYMGGRSLDAIYKHLLQFGGRVGERVIGKIADSVLQGLSYLHERKIIHRDIKPQNILLNDAGYVKLCDFGVSGEVVNSLATTFTGTSYYMAPERIQGQPYSVTSDVWSLGLTLLEVAQARFPFESTKMAANMPPIELLMLILTFTPQLNDDPEHNIVWSKAFKSFIEYCLKKESRERPSPRQMLQHPWILGQRKRSVNMEKFVQNCWQAR